MQGRLENQIKAENKIKQLLKDMPHEVNEYYINFSANKEFRSCLGYIQKLKRFLVWYSEENDVLLSKIDFSVITDTEIASYLKKCEKKETNEGIEYTSFSYRKQVWSILNSFFEFLERKRKIVGNPVRLIERPTKNDKVSHVFLNKSDLDKMITLINKEIEQNKNGKNNIDKWKTRDLAILYMFIFTGMRESALCEIDVNKINFNENNIEVIDKEHKTNSYTISPKLKEILKMWIKCRNDILKDANNDALFISNQKKRINQETVRVIIRKYSESALGQAVSPHRLRAAYGNIIYNETHDIELTRRAMKHSNISTTKIYLEDDEKETNNKVADIMNDIF